MKKKLLIIGAILLVFLVCSIFIFFVNKDKLENTSWRLDEWKISSKSLDKNDITLNFSKDSIGGSGGVNSYGGEYKIGIKNTLEIKSIFSTEMASEDPEVNHVESTYFNLLTEVKYYELSNNKLTLYDEDNNEILIFIK